MICMDLSTPHFTNILEMRYYIKMSYSVNYEVVGRKYLSKYNNSEYKYSFSSQCVW
jgi:hypothetical protein